MNLRKNLDTTIDNILPDFIFDGVRLSISRSSISRVGKKRSDSAKYY